MVPFRNNEVRQRGSFQNIHFDSRRSVNITASLQARLGGTSQLDIEPNGWLGSRAELQPTWTRQLALAHRDTTRLAWTLLACGDGCEQKIRRSGG
jgi:hypothetical protein